MKKLDVKEIRTKLIEGLSKYANREVDNNLLEEIHFDVEEILKPYYRSHAFTNMPVIRVNRSSLNQFDIELSNKDGTRWELY